MKVWLWVLMLGLVACKNAAPESTTKVEVNTSTTPSVAAGTAAAGEATKLLTASEFVDKMVGMEKGTYYLVDVRTKGEVDNGALVDAVNIDFQSPDFEAELDKLDKSKAVFIYCQGGVRSAKACKTAEKLKFKQVFDMEGGYAAWMKI